MWPAMYRDMRGVSMARSGNLAANSALWHPSRGWERKRRGVAERGGTADGKGEPPKARPPDRRLGAARAAMSVAGARDKELISPLVLFGSPASERAQQTGAASERTLQRKTRRFEGSARKTIPWQETHESKGRS